MPQFFFDIKDGEYFHDVEGSDWPDLAAVRVESVRLAGEVLKEMPERFWQRETMVISVSDRHRHSLFTIRIMVEAPSAKAA